MSSTAAALATARSSWNGPTPSRATRPHGATEASRCSRTELDQRRLVERGALATALDHDLRRACRAEAVARRLIGTLARELLRRRAYGRLGFVRLADYAAERLGVSARVLQTAARVATRLEALPTIAAAFARGELSWTQVRLLCEVAEPANEAVWLARARGATVDALAALVRGESGAPVDGDDDLLDGEPPVRLRIACPARVRALWRHALERAQRVAGEPLASWRAAELIAAEGIAGRPAGVSVGDRVLRALLRLTRRAKRAGDHPTSRPSAALVPDAAGVRGGEAAGRASVAPIDTGAVAVDELVLLPGLVADLTLIDAFELDARLRAAMRTLRTIEPQIGQRLRLVVDHQLYRALAYRSVDAYVRERLGLSARKAWALVKVEKAARRAPAFAAAYREGTVSWVRALTLLPVVDRETAAAWIARAGAVTVRRLADEVNWVLDGRDVFGPDASLAPPPLDAALVSPVVAARGADGLPAATVNGPRLCRVVTPSAARVGVQIGAPSFSDPAWTKNGTPPRATLDVADAEIDFIGPATVVALFRDAVEVFERGGEPRWLAVERLLNNAVADWEALPRHPDPVFARDGWRCQVPACSGRRELQDHHIVFRSRGGSNARSNRITLCASHHHHGIHNGVIRASGEAPRNVRWELGIRAAAPALLTLVGDRYCD